MAIEKAFAINASPREIFAAIEHDLDAAAAFEGETFSVLRRDGDRSIDLDVTIGGIPCRLRYRLEPTEQHTEVVGTLAPYGWRYAAFRIMTLGLRDQNFAVALVQALSNLKTAVEGDGEEK